MAGQFVPIPDWFSRDNQDCGIAVGDLNGNGRPDLVVFLVDNPAGQNQGYYRIGRDLALMAPSPAAGPPGSRSRTGTAGRTRAPTSA
ncbi:FG-GAP repeat domain-containing protein [Nocardia sp. NPDC004151]|uniref:FG-GAP repeat domain-containing protein n=1 Tax=Nocardia sp. NPDC004151 TaxID=3364304 RepID=UPI0036787B25